MGAERQMTGCIFGGADISDYSRICIPEGAYVIAADGGYRHCVRLGIRPHCIVGDFDSNTCGLPRGCEIIRAPAEKDETDTLLAVKICMERQAEHIRIFGADGGRMGHTFANIQTLSFIAEAGFAGVIIGNGFDMYVMLPGKRSFFDDGYNYVSLFSLSDSSEVLLNGLKYSGVHTLTADFPKGVSNEFSSPSCEIEVKSGRILIIFEK